MEAVSSRIFEADIAAGDRYVPMSPHGKHMIDLAGSDLPLDRMPEVEQPILGAWQPTVLLVR